MEIAPVPHRSSRVERRRLALALLVLAPVVLLVLLPAVLGLNRYVVTDGSMDGGLGRGAVVLAREVASADLRVGDVVSFEPPTVAGDGDRVTRRVVAIEDGLATTKGDANDSVDPWRLPLDDGTYARVWLSVPWVGYPFLMDGGWILLTAAAAGALGAAVLTGRGRLQHTPRAPSARVSVG